MSLNLNSLCLLSNEAHTAGAGNVAVAYSNGQEFECLRAAFAKINQIGILIQPQSF